MKNRAQTMKPSEISLGKAQEFMIAFGRAGGTPELLQKVIESQKTMGQFVSILGGSSPYAGQVVESNYGYPGGFKIRSVQEQIKILRQYIPNLDYSRVDYYLPDKGEWCPNYAEGYAVIPRFNKIGAYYEALVKVLELIAKTRMFNNFCNENYDGQSFKNKLRMTEKTSQSLAAVESRMNGDVLAFPFQFGKKFAGRSICNARANFAGNEFGLGPYEVAILLLTHPDRITGFDQLNIWCAGCDYDRYNLEKYISCLYFNFWDSAENPDNKALSLMCESPEWVQDNVAVATGFWPLTDKLE